MYLNSNMLRQFTTLSNGYITKYIVAKSNIVANDWLRKTP